MRDVIHNIVAAAEEAGIEGMERVDPPYSLIPICDNDGVSASVLLAPDFGEHSPWCVPIDPCPRTPKGGVIPAALQVAQIEEDPDKAFVLAARVVALFPTEDSVREPVWRPLGPFQEVPRSPHLDVWESWILGVEKAIAEIPALVEKTQLSTAHNKALATREAAKANVALNKLYPNLRIVWHDDTDDDIDPSYQVRLEDSTGHRIYSARCEDLMSAIDNVTSWTWQTLIVKPHDCEIEA